MSRPINRPISTAQRRRICRPRKGTLPQEEKGMVAIYNAFFLNPIVSKFDLQVARLELMLQIEKEISKVIIKSLESNRDDDNKHEIL